MLMWMMPWLTEGVALALLGQTGHPRLAPALGRRCFDQVVPQLHVRLGAATVELVRVEAEAERRIHVPRKALEGVAVVRAAPVRASARVAVPSRREIE